MLFVIALPPTIRNFPASRVPLTAVFINIGLVGAVVGGPLFGGAIASVHGWRWLFAGFVPLGIATVSVAFLTLGKEEPKNPDLPVDKLSLVFAAGVTILTVGAAAALAKVGFASRLFSRAIWRWLGLLCRVSSTQISQR